MHCIVLGSGFGDFVLRFKCLAEWTFEELLDMPFEQLEGHERKLFMAKWEGVPFLILSGKFHFYEGLGWEDIIKPYQYVLANYDIDSFVITSAAGGLSERAKVGEWCKLTQVWSIPCVNGLSQRLISAGEGDGFSTCKTAVYAYHQGPNTGSLSEYKMLAKLGADLIGMSMLPEWMFLQSENTKAVFISLPVCNYHPLQSLNEPPYEEVIRVASAGVPKLVGLFKGYLENKQNGID